MRILKHFVKVAKMQWIRLSCNHEESHEASCPFTGMTYINCIKCWKRLGVVPTDEFTNRNKD
jgi:hypothetical protein